MWKNRKIIRIWWKRRITRTCNGRLDFSHVRRIMLLLLRWKHGLEIDFMKNLETYWIAHAVIGLYWNKFFRNYPIKIIKGFHVSKRKFGRLIVVMLGNPAQLLPSGDNSLWIEACQGDDLASCILCKYCSNFNFFYRKQKIR